MAKKDTWLPQDSYLYRFMSLVTGTLEITPLFFIIHSTVNHSDCVINRVQDRFKNVIGLALDMWIFRGYIYRVGEY